MGSPGRRQTKPPSLGLTGLSQTLGAEAVASIGGGPRPVLQTLGPVVPAASSMSFSDGAFCCLQGT